MLGEVFIDTLIEYSEKILLCDCHNIADSGGSFDFRTDRMVAMSVFGFRIELRHDALRHAEHTGHIVSEKAVRYARQASHP
jgi:hypothetical protein